MKSYLWIIHVGQGTFISTAADLSILLSLFHCPAFLLKFTQITGLFVSRVISCPFPTPGRSPCKLEFIPPSRAVWHILWCWASTPGGRGISHHTHRGISEQFYEISLAAEAAECADTEGSSLLWVLCFPSTPVLTSILPAGREHWGMKTGLCCLSCTGGVKV